LGEIVPNHPRCVGAHDASGTGAGGVWFTPNRNLVWRQQFPPEIKRQLVSTSNLSGALTNSDFEQAGGVWHHFILADMVDIRESTIHSRCDNTPAVSRFQKGSTTTAGAAAYLNRLLALHQRQHRYLSVHDYIPGPDNAMADDASRLWALDDTQFLTHFEQLYPQNSPWELVPMRPALYSPVISSLQRTRSPTPLPPAQRPPHPPRGPNGSSFVQTAGLTPSYPIVTTQSPFSLSLPSATAKAAWPRTNAASLCADLQLPTSSAKWARRWPSWGAPIPDFSRPDVRSSA
jgi:hypothetical protein